MRRKYSWNDLDTIIVVVWLLLVAFLMMSLECSREPPLDAFNENDQTVLCDVVHDGRCLGLLQLPKGTTLPPKTVDAVHATEIADHATKRRVALEDAFQLRETGASSIYEANFLDTDLPEGTFLEFNVVYYTHSFVSSTRPAGVVILRVFTSAIFAVGTLLAFVYIVKWRRQLIDRL